MLNLIYRITTGGPYLYSPLGKRAEWRHSPLWASFDLTFDKELPARAGITPTIFVAVSNLFRQRNIGSTGGDYIRWGLVTPRPDSQTFEDYGDFYVNESLKQSTRSIRMGVRFKI